MSGKKTITREALADMGLKLKDKKALTKEELKERGYRIKKDPERSKAGKERWAAKPEDEKQGEIRRLAAVRAVRGLKRIGKLTEKPDYKAITAGAPFPKDIEDYLKYQVERRQRMIDSGEMVKSKKTGKFYRKRVKVPTGKSNEITEPTTTYGSVAGVQGSVVGENLPSEKPKRGQKKKVVIEEVLGPREVSGNGLYPPGAQFIGQGGEKVGKYHYYPNKDGYTPDMKGEGAIGKFIGGTIGGIAGSFLPF